MDGHIPLECLLENPNPVRVPGYPQFLFTKGSDGRRIEWVNEEVARSIMSQCNRPQRVLFAINTDLAKNRTDDELRVRVEEVISAHETMAMNRCEAIERHAEELKLEVRRLEQKLTKQITTLRNRPNKEE